MRSGLFRQFRSTGIVASTETPLADKRILVPPATAEVDRKHGLFCPILFLRDISRIWPKI